MNSDITIRLASNEDGLVLKSFAFAEGLINLELDWSDIYPYWLIAEHEGEPIGAVQICPSRPIGRIEMLHVEKDIQHQLRKKAVTMLLLTGVETLKGQGAQLVSGVVPFELKSYKEFLKKRGAVTCCTGNLMMWRP